MASSQDAPNPFAFDSIRILGFQNANYDWHNFDLDRDMPLIDKQAGFVDAVDPDLRAFEAQGGKLLLYAGWRDNGITPENTVLYYESVLREMGPKQDDWMRLFLVPGMEHCRGGPGPEHVRFDHGARAVAREGRRARRRCSARTASPGLKRPICAVPAILRSTTARATSRTRQTGAAPRPERLKWFPAAVTWRGCDVTLAP